MQKNFHARAVRGAITVKENTSEEINNATIELLTVVLNENEFIEDDIVSVIFTLTPDLNAEFPAKSARINFGWEDIPMICACEIPVPGSIEKCIRIMMTFNTLKQKNEIKHIYLKDARNLRPDLV